MAGKGYVITTKDRTVCRVGPTPGVQSCWPMDPLENVVLASVKLRETGDHN